MTLDQGAVDEIDGKAISPKSIDAVSASIDQVGAVAGRDRNQALPDSTLAKLNLDTVVFEDTDVATVDTGNRSISVNTTGVFYIHASARIDSDPALSQGDLLALRIYRNGVNERNLAHESAGGSESQTVQIDGLFQLSNGDTIDTRVFQASGSSIDINGSATSNTLEIMKVG